jgi:anti-sigma regulatory factor (Ser/Thr protein kinase)
MISDNVRNKILDLLTRSTALAVTPGMGLAPDTQHISRCRGWIAEALNIIELAVPVPSNTYRRQIEKIGEVRGGGYPQSVGSMAEILRALLQDIDAGLLRTLSNTITAEAFDNFLDHAEEYQKKGQKQEAGVIAGVVFEDTLRRICKDKGIPEKGISLETLINELARKSIITGQQSKQSKVASHVRTKATHAQWDEFDLEGVADTIAITKVLLGEHLGG